MDRRGWGGDGEETETENVRGLECCLALANTAYDFIRQRTKSNDN